MSYCWRDGTALVLVGAVFVGGAARAAGTFGGSLDVTSDYLVRGVSRSNQEPAVQGDLHFVADGGFFAGLFASSLQLVAGDRRTAEFSAFSGFAWAADDAWRLKAVAAWYDSLSGDEGSHSTYTNVYPYGYLSRRTGSHYNYAELGFEAAYAGWLSLNLDFSPDYPRYVNVAGLQHVAQTSAELVLHTPRIHHLSASAGAGHSQLGGAGGGGYAYWSAAGTVDVAPVSLTVTYVNAGAKANALYYGEAAHDQWTATLIWRF